MPDMWVAECLPCKWEFQHDSEIGAVDAANNHVFDLHRNVSSEQRAAQKIGHVQLRTVPLSPPDEKDSAGPSQPDEQVQPHESPVGDEPAGSSLPDSVKYSQDKPKGEESESY